MHILFVFYVALSIVLYCIRPSIVLFSYSAFGCKSVFIKLNQLSVISRCIKANSNPNPYNPNLNPNPNLL